MILLYSSIRDNVVSDLNCTTMDDYDKDWDDIQYIDTTDNDDSLPDWQQ